MYVRVSFRFTVSINDVIICVPNTIDVNFGATILTLTLGEWRMYSGLESGVGRSNICYIIYYIC